MKASVRVTVPDREASIRVDQKLGSKEDRIPLYFRNNICNIRRVENIETHKGPNQNHPFHCGPVQPYNKN